MFGRPGSQAWLVIMLTFCRVQMAKMAVESSIKTIRRLVQEGKIA